jgi:hypothetical protein
MGLEIKDAKVEQLAQEIAALTGESLAQAVTTALEERKTKLERTSRFDAAWAIAQDCARRYKDAGGPIMKVEDLYDEETGLPK